MMMLTKEIRKQLPALYATEEIPTEEKDIIVKFFCPWNNWTWFAVEFDGTDRFFGLVHGFEKEWGYFSLSEMSAVTGPMGLKIERDLYFGNKKIKDIN